MNRYDQHNYRGNQGRDYENRNNRERENNDHNLSNYLSRYQEGGNYYGMPNNDYEYRNVRSTRGENFGRSSSGPVGGYGASSHRGAYDSNSSGNSGSGRDRRNDNYNSGSGNYQSSRGGGSSQDDHYRYGDPNRYMNYERNGGYDRTRGTGWRSESDDSRRGSSDYSRQDNSYQYGGSGKRFNEFGNDERYNYGHGERMTDIHTDRGEHRNRRSDNNYGNEEYRRNNRKDNYATGMYSSNRAYLADHGQDRDEDIFDHTSDNYPNRSPRGYGYKSGPDWSADSPMNRGHHPSADRG